MNGLREFGYTQVAEALAAFRNVRFVVLSLVRCFVLGPVLAVLHSKIIPLVKMVTGLNTLLLCALLLWVYRGEILSGFAAAAVLKRFCAPAGAT